MSARQVLPLEDTSGISVFVPFTRACRKFLKYSENLFDFQQKPCYILLRLMPAYFPALRLRTNSTKV